MQTKDGNVITLPGFDQDRPLAGQTILLVEDSRVGAAAIRAFCQKSGARLRRADTLLSAHRHLATYRPTVAIIDLGLPDGSGLDVISELAATGQGRPLILALSGEDPSLCRPAALEAGADGFLAKPIASLGAFQQAILSKGKIAGGVSTGTVQLRDRQPLYDDVKTAVALLEEAGDASALAYGAQFVASVAATLADRRLAQGAERLRLALNADDPPGQAVADLLAQLRRRTGAEGALTMA